MPDNSITADARTIDATYTSINTSDWVPSISGISTSGIDGTSITNEWVAAPTTTDWANYISTWSDTVSVNVYTRAEIEKIVEEKLIELLGKKARMFGLNNIGDKDGDK